MTNFDYDMVLVGSGFDGATTPSPQREPEVDRYAEDQAALRRVATLVARGATLDAIFRAVAAEVRVLFGADVAAVLSYADDGTATVLAGVGGSPPFDVGGPDPTRAGSLVRMLGARSAVANPVLVGGRLWGAVTVASRHARLAPTAERRLMDFTELVATAVVNAEAREHATVLAEEQAALRRVAELVARESSPAEIFQAVANEAARVLDTEAVGLLRFEADGTATLVAQSATPWDPPPMGTRFTLDGDNVVVQVVRTHQAARADDWADATGAVGAMASVLGVRSSVATPIVVEGRLWGTMLAATSHREPLADDTENRLAQFTELVATAIANADSLDQLMASRARLVLAGDAARRRVVRDLHDGAQQRLVHTIVTLKLARRAVREADAGQAELLLGKALEYAEQGNAELRELAHGILPAVLTNGGLGAAVEALVERLDLPVDVDVRAGRFEAEVEANAYFVVAEALTNVAKHARAAAAEVKVYANDGVVCVEVRDDGVGGADRAGHGLLGLADRASALGGRLDVESPSGSGTRVAATLPLAGERQAAVRQGALARAPSDAPCD